MTKVWAVMEKWVISDDGNDNVDIAAVHASKEGAEANLTVTEKNYGGERERYVVEMELLP